MRKTFLIPRGFLLAAAVALPAAVSACATHRYYDSDDRVYHRWNHDEVVFYQRWERETRRPHVDYDRRSDNDRRAYWHWRHDHRGDHGDDHRERHKDRD
jgi:hypothetical protein